MSRATPHDQNRFVAEGDTPQQGRESFPGFGDVDRFFASFDHVWTRGHLLVKMVTRVDILFYARAA